MIEHSPQILASEEKATTTTTTTTQHKAGFPGGTDFGAERVRENPEPSHKLV